MPLFVVLRDGATLDSDLEREIARRIREQCSPRHVPDRVFQLAEVPRTLSGKVLEVPVKRILMGTPPEQAATAVARQPRLARLLHPAGGPAPKDGEAAREGPGRRPAAPG